MRSSAVRSHPALSVAAALIVALAGCGEVGSTPDRSPGGSGGAAPTAAPSPTPPPEPSDPADSAGTTGLVLRLAWCADVCASEPGTTILEDGRVIWRNEAMWVERRLTAAGLATLLDRLDATAAFAASGDYSPQLRPGAQPAGHGVTSYAFTVARDGKPVRVTSGRPEDYAGEEAFWEIPPEMAGLAEFAKELMDPAASFPADAWATDPVGFRPPGYLMIVNLRRDEGPRPELAVDLDEVAWLLAASIDVVGSPYVRNGEVVPNARCLPIAADLARRIAAAEASAGLERRTNRPYTDLEYGWARGNGSASVEMRWLMPDEPWSCSAPGGW